ncbi:MAG: EF-P lysine aminoacylase GenX [Deltaproteobacteria bacterium]|nr:MAG: EF-P lysine aminoacylase GenX [Deltaproteobacteria bacterium]
MNQNMKSLFTLQQVIRDFFREQDFMDVMTPPVVSNPGMETHIHPFGLYQVHGDKKLNRYLHTSPEFHMKNLLAEGFEKIFTLTYCFRDEPASENHRSQFVMLEWYRTLASYEAIMDDCEGLLDYTVQKLELAGIEVKGEMKTPMVRKTVQEIFKEFLDLDILEHLEVESLRTWIEGNGEGIPLPKEELSFDDLFFLIFLNKIEPELKKYPKLLLYEWPYQLAALSKISEKDSRVCERFEIYLEGLELCNCFHELCDLSEQKKRFEAQAKEKKELYGYNLPEAKLLYQSLEKGLDSPSGIALGVERLLKGLTGMEDPFFISSDN